MPLTRLASKNRGPTAQSTTIAEPTPPAKVKGKPRAPTAETITVGGGTLARLANKIRTGADTIVIAETRTRLATKLRPLATQSVTISESIARIDGISRALATQTVTITGGTLARLTNKIRTRAETVTIGESLARLCSKTRALVAQTTTIGGGTAAITARGKVRAISQTTVIGESLARLSAKSRALAAQTVTVGGGTLARLAAKIRALATQTVAFSDSVTGVKTTGQKDVVKALAAETIAVAEALVRRAAKTRARTDQNVIIGDALTRLTTKTRALATQILSLSDIAAAAKTTGAQNIVRALATQTVTVSDSLSRLTTKIRALSAQIVSVSETPNRSSGKSRVLPTQSATVSDILNRTITTTTGVVRGLIESVTLSESLNRLAIKRRALTAETTVLSENIAKITGTVRAIPAQTVTVGAGTLARRTQKIRTLLESNVLLEIIKVFKNGLELIPPQPSDVGGSGKSPLYPRGPRLKQIKYPVYHVTERQKLERRRKLRGDSFVVIPAFKFNVHKTVAPIIITNIPRARNTINGRFVIQRRSPNVLFTGKIPIPVRILAANTKKQAHKARCASFIMNQKTIERYGSKLNKISKLMTLFLLAELELLTNKHDNKRNKV
jgi:hypothetical protein